MRGRRIHVIVASSCLAVTFVLLLAWILSPRFYASSIQSAVQGGNLAVLAKRLNATGLAESTSMMTEPIPGRFVLKQGGKLDENLRQKLNASFSAINGVDPAFVEKMRNFLLGRGMVTQSLLAEVPTEARALRTPEFSSESGDTMDIYLLRVAFKETGEQVVMTLERRGWFTWRAARIAASGGNVLWPVRGKN